MITNLVALISTDCNLNCSYCFVYEQKRTLPDKKLMSEDTALKMVDFALKGSCERFSLSFFGGEPLLNWEVLKIATVYASKEFKKYGKTATFGLTTNLTLLDEEKAEFLRYFKFNVVASLDGWRESHQAQRSDFDLATDNLNRIDWTDPSIRYTITPETVKYISESLITLYGYGLKNIALEPAYEMDWTPEALLEMERASFEIAVLQAKHRDIRTKFIEDGLRSLDNKERMKERCGLGNGSLGVGPDGSLWGCHRFCGQAFSRGDIYDGLQHEYSWDPSKIKVKCRDCLAYKGCNGGCLAVNFDMSGGDIYAPPQAYCKIQKIKVLAALHYKRLI